jgi:hypothetical protein
MCVCVCVCVCVRVCVCVYVCLPREWLVCMAYMADAASHRHTWD